VEQRSHLSEEELEQYVNGQLHSSEILPLEDHLMICTVCQERLDGVEDFAVGMKEALGELPKPVLKRETGASWFDLGWFDWLRRPAFSMAVGFAALILVVGIFSNSGTKIAPTASLVLTAVRGEMPQTVPARQFDLTLKDSPNEGGPFRVEVVTGTGAQVWSGLAVAGPSGVQVTEPRRLDAGDYFVRLYGADGKLLREYGFRVRP
jgi:hypothetical protein